MRGKVKISEQQKAIDIKLRKLPRHLKFQIACSALGERDDAPDVLYTIGTTHKGSARSGQHGQNRGNTTFWNSLESHSRYQQNSIHCRSLRPPDYKNTFDAPLKHCWWTVFCVGMAHKGCAQCRKRLEQSEECWSCILS